MAKVPRRQFVNTTQGHVGAVRITARGDEVGVGVAPGETVWLSDDEVEATANAPQNPKHNPFLPHPYKVFDPETADVLEEGTRAPLEPIVQDRELPEEGTYSSGEEVGTPVGG